MHPLPWFVFAELSHPNFNSRFHFRYTPIDNQKSKIKNLQGGT